MAIEFNEYITASEYNEITSREESEAITQTIQEASEYIDYFITPNQIENLNVVGDYESNLKKATAWQIAYTIDNGDVDDTQRDGGFRLGDLNISGDNSSKGLQTKEQRKIAPKSRRYLFNGGYLNRGMGSKWV